jgi:hypothetical protein
MITAIDRIWLQRTVSSNIVSFDSYASLCSDFAAFTALLNWIRDADNELRYLLACF